MAVFSGTSVKGVQLIGSYSATDTWVKIRIRPGQPSFDPVKRWGYATITRSDGNKALHVSGASLWNGGRWINTPSLSGQYQLVIIWLESGIAWDVLTTTAIA